MALKNNWKDKINSESVIDAKDINDIAHAVIDLEDEQQEAVKGENGATFIPSVSSNGVISWTNDQNLPNPTPVNIKGEKGEKGDTGEMGPIGPAGPQGVRGADGHTPQYGVDYGTPEQIADIANQTYDILADDIQKMLDGKVDKVEGMGLSSNDYDNVAKVKVDAIPEDAKYTDTVYDDTEVKQSISQIKDDISDKFDYKNPQELTEAQQSAIQSAIGIRSVEGVLF